MTRAFDIKAIEARQREIVETIDALQSEAEELAIALKVAERFSTAPTPPASGGKTASKLGPPRPEGVPSLFVMTETVLTEGMEIGLPGYTGADIVREIGAKYWPGVRGEQILPSIYQFAKKGRIEKTADGIFRPKKKENAPKSVLF